MHEYAIAQASIGHAEREFRARRHTARFAGLEPMRRHPTAADASVAGVLTREHSTMVVMRTGIGSARVVDLHPGEILPRIC